MRGHFGSHFNDFTGARVVKLPANLRDFDVGSVTRAVKNEHDSTKIASAVSSVSRAADELEIYDDLSDSEDEGEDDDAPDGSRDEDDGTHT